MKFLISTSKKPSNYTRSFAKDLEKVLPNAFYLTRGKANLDYIFYFAQENSFDVVVLIGEKHGNPGTLEFYNPDGSLRGLILDLKGVKLMRDMKNKLDVDIYSSSTAITKSYNFKDIAYIKILEKITGLPFLDGDKKEILKKYSTIMNVEYSLDKNCIFRICFYTLVNNKIVAIGPVIKVEGFL